MRRITLLALVALTGCLKQHNVSTAPTPRLAPVSASHSTPVTTTLRDERK